VVQSEIAVEIKGSMYNLGSRSALCAELWAGTETALGARRLGVQIDYDVVHLRTSLVQLFVLLQLNLY
jgi:hypothetical protein